MPRARQPAADPGAEVAHGLRLQLVDEDRGAELGHQRPPAPAARRGSSAAELVAGISPSVRRSRGAARAPARAAALHGSSAGEVAERLVGSARRRSGSTASRCRGSQVLGQRASGRRSRCRSSSSARGCVSSPDDAGAAGRVDRHPQHVRPRRRRPGSCAGRVEWMTAEWPAPPIRSSARAASIPRARVRHAHEPEQREQLLARERLLGHDQRERRDEHARPRRHADLRRRGQRRRVLAGQRRRRCGRPG